MPTCKHCGSAFEGVYRQKYCSDKCRLMFRTKANENGCWEWQGSDMKMGYGALNVNGVVVTAHRLAYTIFKGGIPVGMFVCHTCDNKICVNPEHLFVGTHASNMADMAKKGRAAWAVKPRPRWIVEKARLAKVGKVYPISEQQRAAAAETMNRLWASDAFRKKMKLRMSGENNPASGKMSDEQRVKMQPYWDASRGKTGRKNSPEAIERMRIAARNRYAKPGAKI